MPAKTLLKNSPHTSQMLSDVTRLEQVSDGLVLSLNINKNLAFFPGHFPGHPIVPGVVQLKWAEHFAQQYFSIKGQFTRLEAVKFQHVLTAGTNTKLWLSYSVDGNKLSYRFYSELLVFSSGRMVFSGVADDA